LISKATANSRAVEERQSLEKLKRDHKVNGRTLATLQAKNDEFESKQTTLMQDYETWKEKSAAVSIYVYYWNRRP
jgi:hypothetical protein